MIYRTTGRPSVGSHFVGVLSRLIRRIKRPSSASEWAGAAVVTMVLLSIALDLASALLNELLTTWWQLPAIIAVAGMGAWAYARARVFEVRAAARRLADLRYTLQELDALTPTEFEAAVRDLMIRDGITARQVGGRGDKAADVIGEHMPTRQTIVVQCKHTATARKVDVRVVYQVHGTAGPAHRAHVAVIVTNGGFTRDAQQQAADFNMALIDRAALAQWATHGTSLCTTLALGKAIRGRRYRLRNRPADS